MRLSNMRWDISKMKEVFTNSGSTCAYAIISAIFTVIPEDIFLCGFVPCDLSDPAIIVVNRIFACVIVFVLANIVYLCYKKVRKSVVVAGKNFTISIEYGDLLNIPQGRKVINFDECYSTKVGQEPGDIKPASICGQYLTKFPIDNIQELIENAGVASKGVSKYNKMPKYKLGTIVPRYDFFLMAFTELDEDGLSKMTYDRYLDCLDYLWQQIDKYHGTEDVYVPILGSHITRLDKELTQQELLDVMIASYRLSPYKLKNPFTLHIVCVGRDGFSLNNIWGI